MCSGCLEQDGPVLQAQRYQLRQQHLHAGVAYAQLLGGLCWESAACCTRSRSKPFVALNEPSLAENAGKKVLNMLAWTGVDRKTDVRMATPFGDSKMDGSTAAGDDSVAASEKSSDVGLDRLEETPVVGPAALRKTLSCSAKGILGCKLVESASGPVLPPGSPMSPTSPRCSGMATSASQFLPRESTGWAWWHAAPVKLHPPPMSYPHVHPAATLFLFRRLLGANSAACGAEHGAVYSASSASSGATAAQTQHAGAAYAAYAAYAACTVGDSNTGARDNDLLTGVPTSQRLQGIHICHGQEQIAKETAASERREKARCDICEARACRTASAGLCLSHRRLCDQLLTQFWQFAKLLFGCCPPALGGSAEPSSDPQLPTELEDLGAEGSRTFEWGAGQVKRRRRIPANKAEVSVEDEAAQKQLPGKQRIFLKTYGCAHNNSDSEFMMGLLQDYGYTLVETMQDADALVVNSCTVKGPSQDNAVNLVKSAQDAGKPVVLAGCVPTADVNLAKSLMGVSMLGVTQLDRVVEVVEHAIQGNTISLLTHRRSMPSLDLPKVRRNSFVEIIPISGGCLGNCSYCKTKHARGSLSSYSEEAILARALQAASEGVSEVWLTSEDTGAYGLDIGTNIASLLNRVADSLPEHVMLKLGMTNPPYMLAHIDAVAKVFQRPNVFEHLHVPVQSGSDTVLRAMVREYTSSDFRRLVDGLRAQVPGLFVGTDVICGFPAESEEDHQATLALVRDYRFPMLNISQFYPRPNTAAARLKKLPGNIVKARSTEMTQLFESYSTWNHLVGCTQRVWFSDTDEKRQQTVGHTKGYAKVVQSAEDALLGRSALVKVTRATKWHVEAVVEASQLDVSATDLATLRQVRTKLLNALASAQEVDLPRVERSVAEQQRRRLHNALQDMKGQLRVSCRIRPLSDQEKTQKGETGELALRPLDGSRVELSLREGPAQVFEFDSVFRPDVPQQVVEEIFEDCRDLAQSAVDGHNVTVMTYGQTGAGKTYTLFGSKDQEGLVQYMIREVFARLADQAEDDEECTATVTGSALELYNNHFIDLLRPVDRTGRQAPGVKVCVDAQGCVEVDGLEQEVAQTPVDLLEILEKGLAQRVVAEHALNADSSRSHMVFTVRIQTEGSSKKTTRKLTFCDLGGCERIKRSQVAGDLQKEAIEINKSLSALSSVIEAVAGRRRHIPYRDHKLTRLLRDAVGGSAKVLMYVCCSPARSNIEETAAALKLASRAAKVVNQQKQVEASSSM
ncbi:cdkal1 [Symbiodinium natans]|uniref:Threonylcarbamoyladenosine tRNA methylthiotransferase n=1 Tax=Symbiodinium natans TaxID=878477 RepID=A0A812KUT1_9DINO|nr:cdkal1 [Symbiodinium natans]